ncbi:MAG: hypothetical protein H0U00_15235 [Actinobacteria bacterium]|nr:hypothetical protein [Actinomycetota bacterium]
MKTPVLHIASAVIRRDEGRDDPGGRPRQEKSRSGPSLQRWHEDGRVEIVV